MFDCLNFEFFVCFGLICRFVMIIGVLFVLPFWFGLWFLSVVLICLRDVCFGFR